MGNKVMGNKMMPMVPSYLRWLEEVSLLNTHHGLVELMVLRSAYSFEAAVTHSCGSQKKLQVFGALENLQHTGIRSCVLKRLVSSVYHDVRHRWGNRTSHALERKGRCAGHGWQTDSYWKDKSTELYHLKKKSSSEGSIHINSPK